jgi:hypothetical protein
VPATSYGATICFAIINGGILGVFWMVRSSMAKRHSRVLTAL